MRYSLRNTKARAERQRRLDQENPPPAPPVMRLTSAGVVPVIIPATVPVTVHAAHTPPQATNTNAVPATPANTSSIYLRAPRAPRKTGLWKNVQPLFQGSNRDSRSPSPTPTPGPSTQRRRVNITTQYDRSRDAAVVQARARHGVKMELAEVRGKHARALARIEELERRLAVYETPAYSNYAQQVVPGPPRISREPVAGPSRNRSRTPQASTSTQARRLGPNGTEVIDDIPYAWVQEAAVGPNGTEMFADDGRRVFVRKQKAYVGEFWRTQKELLGASIKTRSVNRMAE